MKPQTINPNLVSALAGDPWFTPDTCLDVTGLSPNFWPEPVEREDPFEPRDEQNPTAQFKQFLKDEENKQLERASTFYAGQWCVEMRYKAGKWHCSATQQDTGEAKSFTLGNVGSDKDSAMSSAGRYLAQFNPPWRELNEGQLDSLSRIASEGTAHAMQNAAVEYVCCSLNKRPDELDNSGGILNDPRYLPLLDSAAWFAFTHGKPDVDNEAQQWMRAQLGDRAVTINSLFAVYELWQSYVAKRDKGLLFRGTTLDEQPETAEQITEQLDNLSDEQLDALRIQTAQLNARRK